MKARLTLVLLTVLGHAFGQEKPEENPTNEKAQRTYMSALDELRHRRLNAALDGFKKADKQDDGHCVACQRKMVQYGVKLAEWKTAEAGASELLGEAKTPKDLALAYYRLGSVFYYEGMVRHKNEIFTRAHEELLKALDSGPNFPDAVYTDGRVLAHLKQDDAAKARFEQFVKMDGTRAADRQRATRYISDPELARARLAPSFEVTTIDGQKIALDDLQGKVVLIDFWATWCAPCREALPHIRDVARKFQGQPLVILSISLDKEEQTWRDFVAKNEMSWPQYFDGGFNGPVATLFDVHAIPHTFTIDADGVLQDEHIGDASIEGKLKKLLKRAQEMSAVESAKQ